MRHRAHRPTALLAALALVAATLVALVPVATSPTPAGAAVVATNSDPDYATVEFSDPWDFSNAADFTVQGAQNLSRGRCHERRARRARRTPAAA